MFNGAGQKSSSRSGGSTSLRSSARFTSSDDNLIDEAGANRLIYVLAMFFLLFVAILAGKLIYERIVFQSETEQAQRRVVREAAAASAARLEGLTEYMASLSLLERSPAFITRMAASRSDVSGAVIVSESGRVQSIEPQSAIYLSEISLASVSDDTVQVLSTVNPETGLSEVVLARRIGADTLVLGLPNGTLTPAKTSGLPAFIVNSSGTVLDSANIRQPRDPADALGLKPADKTLLVQGSGGFPVTQTQIGETRLLASSAQLPGTNLVLLTADPQPENRSWFVGLMASIMLAITTFLALSMLLSNLLKRIRQIQQVRQTAELSEQRFRIAVEGARGGVWELDLNEDTVFLSASLSPLFGFQDEVKMSSSEFLMLLRPEDRERWLATARRTAVSGDFDLELHPAHIPVVLQARGRPRMSADGITRSRIAGVAIDITEQKAAQFRMLAAEARLHDALRSMSDSFVLYDANKNLVLWNRKFQDFFQLPDHILQPGTHYSSIEYAAGQVIEDAVTSPDDHGWVDLKLRDGRWIRYNERPTADGGIVSMGSDITALKNQENELRNNQEALEFTVEDLKRTQQEIAELASKYQQETIRAENANQSKSDFLANMSHELRTPLNAINGFSEIMQKQIFGPLGDERYVEYVNDILFSGQHLLSLINDILDMSKIEAGKMKLQTEMVNIDDLIQQVVRILRGRAEEAALRLEVDNQSVPEIEADPRALKQILLNLLSNAIKFTPEKGLIKVMAQPKGDGVVCKIIDSGVGISKEDIARLAKPFEQVENQQSQKESQKGTGLGLALSKSLVELHGGRFMIESEVGAGTVVTFALPKRPPKEKPKDDHSLENVMEEMTRLTTQFENQLAEAGRTPQVKKAANG